MSKGGLVVVALAVIAGAVCLADGPVVRNSWVTWDDEKTLHGNLDFNPPTWETLRKIWSEQRAHLYVPVTYTVWWLLAAATWSPPGLNPAVFHAASVGLHILSAWIVFAVALRLTHSISAACLGALLFAVHPVQAETVAWASGLKDLLAGVLSLAAIWLMLMRHDGATSRRRAICVAAATVCYLLALFAKPSAVVVPLLVLAVEWLDKQQIAKDVRFVAAGWLVLAIPVVVLTRMIQPAVDAIIPPVWLRPVIALDALGFYVHSILWPVRLAFVYGRTPDVQLASPWLNIVIAVTAAIAIAFAARRRPEIAATAAVFVIALLPYLGFVPFDFQAFSTVSDHYLYLAMLGPALAVAYLLRNRSSAWQIAFVGVVIVLGMVSRQQTQAWRGKMSLLRHAVAMNPDRAPPHAALAAEFWRRNNLADAEREYRRAIEISPHDKTSQTNLAHVLSGAGRSVEAVEQYRAALAASPHDTLMLNNLGIALARVGKADEAMAVFRAALAEEDDSKNDMIHGNLGRVLLSQGKVAEARAELEKSLAINPELEHARRGLELIQQAEQQLANPAISPDAPTGVSP